jgi:hypothetical protein
VCLLRQCKPRGQEEQVCRIGSSVGRFGTMGRVGHQPVHLFRTAFPQLIDGVNLSRELGTGGRVTGGYWTGLGQEALPFDDQDRP